MGAAAPTLSECDLRRRTPVIVVLLGTNPYPFTRLLAAVDAWAGQNREKVLAQIGHTVCEVQHIEAYDFLPHQQIMEWLDDADVLITQGGFGSIMDCLRASKPTIVVPRHPELGESQDNQAELARAIADRGEVIYLDDIDNLDEAIRAAREIRVSPRRESSIPQIVAEKVSLALDKRG